MEYEFYTADAFTQRPFQGAQIAVLLAAEGLDSNQMQRIAAELNDRMENIGARRLQTVLTTVLENLLFDLPEEGKDRVVLDPPFVRERLGGILEDEDLRRYIL